MLKKIAIFIVIAGFAALSGMGEKAKAACLADIKANGSGSAVTLAAGDTLTLTISLDAGSAADQEADWWLVAYTSGIWACFDLAGGWMIGAFPTYQGAIFGFPSSPVTTIPNLPEGEYQFFFGVDTIRNAALDGNALAYDWVTVTVTPLAVKKRLQPTDFRYQGAFRLPGGDTPPQTFAYGGNAMTFNPDGDPPNIDAYPGSLFIMGHDRIPYGAVPDGNQVAEVSIPIPVVSESLDALPTASFIQNFSNVAAGFFTTMEEIPKAGMQYLNHPATGPKIHLAWGQHLQPDNTPSHAWFDAMLSSPNLQGTWFIGNRNLYSVNGYLFEIPAAWADTHVAGRYLATGRMRDGGQGGMGPTLFAYRPWLPDGSAPAPGTHLSETALLLYENADTTDVIEGCMNGYQHPDEWEGGAWITTTDGKNAVLFAGTKSTGTKYWYGYMNPAGASYPCVDAAVTDFTTCRLADGTACPPEDFAGCCNEQEGTCISNRGWWSTRADAQIILYDPDDLAKVAQGTLAPWEPQPYAILDIDEHLYLLPPPWDVINVGSGDQRRYRIGDVAYDRAHDLLYVLELFADGAKPIVHVWKLGGE